MSRLGEQEAGPRVRHRGGAEGEDGGVAGGWGEARLGGGGRELRKPL